MKDEGTVVALFHIKDLYIDGNLAVANGIKIQGTHLIEQVHVSECTNAGIWMSGMINSTILEKVAFTANGTYGLLVNGASNTVFTLRDVTIRAGTGVGFRLDNGVARSYNLLIESNAGVGLVFYDNGVSSAPGGLFTHTYIENNGGATGYQLTMDSLGGGIADGPEGLIFNVMGMNLGATQKGIHITSARFVDFIQLSSSSGDAAHIVDLEAGANYVVFTDCHELGTINGLSTANRSWTTSKNTAGTAGRTFSGSLTANAFITGRSNIPLTAATPSVTGATATAIFTSSHATNYVEVVYVSGYDGGTNSFLDCVTYINTETPAVAFATTLFGTPAARTYTTAAGGVLKLVMATGTYNVAVSAIEILR